MDRKVMSMVFGVAVLCLISSLEVNAEGCKLNIEKSPLPQPLYINISDDDAKDATGFDLNKFYIGDRDGSVTLKTDYKVQFACPGGYLKPFSSEPEFKTLTCNAGGKWKDGSDSHMLGELQCSTTVATAFKYDKDANCGGSNKNALKMEGYNVNKKYYAFSETCYVKDNKRPIYSKYSVSSVVPVEIKDLKIYKGRKEWRWSKFKTVEIFDIGFIDKKLFDKNEDGDEIKKNSAISRGHFSKSATFMIGAHLDGQFFYLNALPRWLHVNKENWDVLEKKLREYAVQKITELAVLVGSNGDITLKKQNKKFKVPFSSMVSDKYIIPHYFWKVVYDPKAKQGVAFALNNDPYGDDPAKEIVDLCSNVCDQLKNWRLKDMRMSDDKKGVVTCCLVDEMRKKIPEIPEVDVGKGLLA